MLVFYKSFFTKFQKNVYSLIEFEKKNQRIKFGVSMHRQILGLVIIHIQTAGKK